MPMLRDPSVKYKPFRPFSLENRKWPSNVMTKAPRWLSTDLRDGNQSLSKPLNVQQKITFFNRLVEIGYKEIEIAFPTSSQTEYDFTRYLVDNPDVVPDDVWLQVMSPCREDLIPATIEAARGAKNAIIHIYIASSPTFLDTVLHMTQDETVALAVRCAKLARSLTKDYQGPKENKTKWTMQFSLESFQDTDSEFAVRICEAVKAVWEPTKEIPMILTLAATVESSTPNIYADLVEYFSTHISNRETVCVSIHPHNDRGTAVAAAEQAVLGGGDRIEGCLFGNGERTGNVDLVTLAMNLYTQGISPNVDFGDMNDLIKLFETNCKMPVHARLPYSGRLVYCTFAGSHQDAIKKGFALRKEDPTLAQSHWDMPYLPIDPGDIGRAHEPLIRITSQSGKGGGAYIVQENLGIDMPRNLQTAFIQVLKTRSDETCRELTENDVMGLFDQAFLKRGEPENIELVQCNIKETAMISSVVKSKQRKRISEQYFQGVFNVHGLQASISGHGIDSLSAIIDALTSLNIIVSVGEEKHQVINSQNGIQYCSCVEATKDGKTYKWGVGLNKSRLKAMVYAVLSAVISLEEAESCMVA